MVDGVLAMRHEMAEDFGVLADIYEREVELITLRKPMCPRFHQDQVPCRLLITLAGPATEWIPSAQVDRICLKDRTTQTDPLLPGAISASW